MLVFGSAFRKIKQAWFRALGMPSSSGQTAQREQIPPDPEQHYRPNADVVTEVSGNDLILVHLGRGTTFRLNRTGKIVWELIIAGRTPREIIGHIGQLWSVPAAQLESEVSLLMANLLQAGLVEPVPEAKP